MPEHSNQPRSHHPQTADSSRLLVTADPPLAHKASLRPTMASWPRSSPKKNTNLVLLQRNQYFLPKTNNTCVGTHELHLCLPPSPLSTYPPGREGSRGRIPNILPLEVGGGMVWQYAKIHTLFLCFPQRKIKSAILPINIRLPPGKRLHRQQAKSLMQSISGFPPEKDCIGNRPWK